MKNVSYFAKKSFFFSIPIFKFLVIAEFIGEADWR